MKINEKTASNKSLDRRTRSRCGEWASPGGGLMSTQGSPWARDSVPVHELRVPDPRCLDAPHPDLPASGAKIVA